MSGAYLDDKAIPNVSKGETFLPYIRTFRAKNGQHRIAFFVNNQHIISVIPSEPTTSSSILDKDVLISKNGAWAVFSDIRKRLPMNEEGTAIKADQSQLETIRNEQFCAYKGDCRVFFVLSDDGNQMFSKTCTCTSSKPVYETFDLDSGNTLWKWEASNFLPKTVDFRTKSVFGVWTNIPEDSHILELDQQNGSLRRVFPAAYKSVQGIVIAPCGDLVVLASHAESHGFQLDQIQRNSAQIHTLISVKDFEGVSFELCDPMPEHELQQIYVRVQESGLIKDIASLVLQFVDEKPRAFVRVLDPKILENSGLQCVILPRHLFRSPSVSSQPAEPN